MIFFVIFFLIACTIGNIQASFTYEGPFQFKNSVISWNDQFMTVFWLKEGKQKTTAGYRLSHKESNFLPPLNFINKNCHYAARSLFVVPMSEGKCTFAVNKAQSRHFHCNLQDEKLKIEIKIPGAGTMSNAEIKVGIKSCTIYTMGKVKDYLAWNEQCIVFHDNEDESFINDNNPSNENVLILGKEELETVFKKFPQIKSKFFPVIKQENGVLETFCTDNDNSESLVQYRFFSDYDFVIYLIPFNNRLASFDKGDKRYIFNRCNQDNLSVTTVNLASNLEAPLTIKNQNEPLRLPQNKRVLLIMPNENTPPNKWKKVVIVVCFLAGLFFLALAVKKKVFCK